MSPQASAHPLDAELLDYVEGTCDAESARSIASHLAQCLLCRIKRQRLTAAPPMELTDVRSIVAPDFVALDVEPGKGDLRPGQLWLTSADDATMVLVRSIRTDGDGVVVVPVTLDVEAADQRVLVLDESASPLAVPMAIYEDLVVSLPIGALAERIIPNSDVDLMALADDDEGVSRGAPIRSATDPRLELRQYLVDRLTALDPYEVERDDGDVASDERPPRVAVLRDELLLRRGPTCDVQDLRNLPPGTTTPPGWTAIARVSDFTVRLIVIETPQGLQAAGDFTAAQALVTRLAASAMAVCTPESDIADVYDAPALFRAFQLPEGSRSSEPIISRLWLPDAVAKYLDQKRVVVSAIGLSSHHAPRVDAADVLSSEVVSAIDATVRRGPRLSPEKRDGYLQLAGWRTHVADVLKRALAPDFDPQWIADAITGADK
jgi:hypothetical protein